MRKIMVLLVVDKFDYHGAYINGPARYFSWLVNKLDKDRFEIKVCALRARGRSDELFQRENIVVTYLHLNKYNPLTFLSIWKLIKKESIDIVHLSGYGATTFGRIAALLARKPSIIHEHWVDPNFRWPLTFVEALLSRTTTRAIAISDYAKNFLISKKRIRENTIKVILNGIPLDHFCNTPQTLGQAKRHQLGIPPDVPVIGIVGMLHKNKGHKYFIEAAKLLKPEIPNARFVIIGDGELRQELEQQVANVGLQGYVMFLGQQEDMPATLRMLDIFAISSLSETASLSLLEAMAAGKAIIASDCGGPSEVIRNGESGFIVPVRDPEAIAEKIRYFVNHNPQVVKMAVKAQQQSKHYDIAFTARQLEQLYEELFTEASTTSTLSR